jgi:hypothetical protein
LRVSSGRVFNQQRPLLISAAGVAEVGSVRCVPFLYGDYSVFPLFFTWLRNTFYMAYKKVLRSLPARNT